MAVCRLLNVPAEIIRPRKTWSAPPLADCSDQKNGQFDSNPEKQHGGAEVGLRAIRRWNYVGWLLAVLVTFWAGVMRGATYSALGKVARPKHVRTGCFAFPPPRPHAPPFAATQMPGI